MAENEVTTADALIRVLVADGTRIGSQLMLETLRRDHRFDAVALLNAADEFIPTISEFKPDVLVIGAVGNGNVRVGFDLLWRILGRFPRAKAVMVLEPSADELAVEAFRAGARGVLCWDDGLDALRKCVHVVHLGQIWATSAQLGFVLEVFSRRWVPGSVVDSNGRTLLSKRELDVVRCLAEGMTNREIASQLNLSEHTVKNYLFRTFNKVGVSNRSELILYALNHSSTPTKGEHARSGSISNRSSELKDFVGEATPKDSRKIARVEHGRRTDAVSNLLEDRRDSSI
jgi:DNA-binding NarL/FixJ family response regulator